MDLVRRRIPAGLACLVLLFSLTGCMRFKIATSIVNDNEIHLSMDLGVTKSSAQAVTARDMCTSDAFKGMAGNGLTTVPYDDGTYVGCRISGTTTLAQLQPTSDSPWSLTRDGRVYKFSMKPSGLNDDNSISGATLTAGVIDDFDISVTFPGTVLSHSGDSTVDGKTVSWKSANDLTQTLTATGRDSGGVPWWVWLVAGIALLGLVGAVLAVVTARNRAKARARAHEAEQQWAAQQSASMWGAQQWDGQWANPAGAAGWVATGPQQSPAGHYPAPGGQPPHPDPSWSGTEAQAWNGAQPPMNTSPWQDPSGGGYGGAAGGQPTNPSPTGYPAAPQGQSSPPDPYQQDWHPHEGYQHSSQYPQPQHPQYPASSEDGAHGDVTGHSTGATSCTPPTDPPSPWQRPE